MTVNVASGYALLHPPRRLRRLFGVPFEFITVQLTLSILNPIDFLLVVGPPKIIVHKHIQISPTV